MTNAATYPEPLAAGNLPAYFHEALQQALENQRIQAQEATIHYLVNLLTHYARSENLFDLTDDGLVLRPLAQFYASAAEATSEYERRLWLRRLGDVALFVAGLFSARLEHRRRLVGLDYYVAMGGRAYSHLFDRRGNAPRDQALTEVFGQLADQFSGFVEVLAEIREASVHNDPRDLLRLYEAWHRSGSSQLQRRLHRRGVVAASPAGLH